MILTQLFISILTHGLFKLEKDVKQALPIVQLQAEASMC